MRVLYSFPHRIGASRICTTAWYQVAGVAATGVDVVAAVGSVARPLPNSVKVVETLARGRVKIPYRAVGSRRMFAAHDHLVARWLRRHRDEIDLVHVWPSGALETLRIAKELDIPTFLERPNANTRYAFEVVRQECERLGVELPPGHEHAFNARVLAKEEAEYDLTDWLLCPSEFTAWTFRNAGYSDEKLVRHFYGVDTELFFPGDRQGSQFTAAFVGVAAVRKGLHFALEAWQRSSASSSGRFLIAGDILPEYRRILDPWLADPSVTVLGHSDAVPELMREAHVLLLPSIEEGFGLVCTEAMASGSVPLVSDACTDLCCANVNALVHRVGDVDALSAHLSLVSEDGATWRRLRDACLASRDTISWDAAAERLAEAYADAVSTHATSRGALQRSESAVGPNVSQGGH
jgi:glycosyltransferase involved in cell wall biosynthesis